MDKAFVWRNVALLAMTIVPLGVQKVVAVSLTFAHEQMPAGVAMCRCRVW